MEIFLEKILKYAGKCGAGVICGFLKGGPDGNHAVCGTRGWWLEEEQKPHNAKVLNRELLRLETSLKAAGEKPIFCFLHYPPLYQGYQCPEILSMLETYKVELCCYGHLHGPVIRRRQEGKYGNTEFSLISGDYLGFVPKKICEK